jgi:hypothetical protein
MEPMYYIGLDVHKRKISDCVKDGGGEIHAEGNLRWTAVAPMNQFFLSLLVLVRQLAMWLKEIT